MEGNLILLQHKASRGSDYLPCFV